jgi:hypothetical protein
MAPLPFGWKLCFSVVARTICLMVNPVLLAVAVALALAAGLELVPVAAGLEAAGLELEFDEHPAAPSTPVARTARPSRADVWWRNIFMITGSNRPR